MSGEVVEQRVQSLLANYATRAEYAPQPRPTWADLVRDLQWALGHERTYVAPDARTDLPTAEEQGDGSGVGA